MVKINFLQCSNLMLGWGGGRGNLMKKKIIELSWHAPLPHCGTSIPSVQDYRQTRWALYRFFNRTPLCTIILPNPKWSVWEPHGLFLLSSHRELNPRHCWSLGGNLTWGITYSPLLWCLGTQKNSSTKMATIISYGHQSRCQSLLGVKEHLFPYPG